MLISNVSTANCRTRDWVLSFVNDPCSIALENSDVCSMTIPFGFPVLPEVNTTTTEFWGAAFEVFVQVLTDHVLGVIIQLYKSTNQNPKNWQIILFPGRS